MKRNHGIQKLVTLVLIGVFTVSNIGIYQQSVRKNKQIEVRLQSLQNESSDLDVGKAD